jgi:hypothetical protein
VIYDKAGSDRPVRHEPANAMRAAVEAAKEKRTIAVSI